jgi:hypothetical protein
MNELLTLGSQLPVSLSVEELMINMFLGLILALIVRWLYLNYSKTLSNKESLGNIFPMLTLITILIISVVKSSLALSLGLVGALSIVRFRSAIKEPEELVYLFLALALGLALGADQRLPAIAALVFIAVTMILRDKFQPSHKSHNFMITFEGKEAEFMKEGKSEFLEIVKSETTRFDLRRVDVDDEVIQARVMIKMGSSTKVLGLIEKLKKKFPKAVISFVDTDAIL